MNATEHRKMKRALRNRGYNLVHRFVVGESLRHAMHFKGQHELWRALHTYKDALTPGERARIEMAYKKIDEAYELLKPMMYRLTQTGDNGCDT